MNEVLSTEATERMKGLHNVMTGEDFIEAAKEILDDLTEEGFDIVEAKQFLINKLIKL